MLDHLRYFGGFINLPLNTSWHGINVLSALEFCLVAMLLCALLTLIFGLRKDRSRLISWALAGTMMFATAAYAANTALSGLTASGALAGANLIYVVQSIGSGGVKATMTQVATFINSLFSGDATVASGGAVTLATVNANVGSFGTATTCVSITVNAKGLITAASAATCTPAVGSVTGFGTGVATALGVNIGTAGSVIVNGGAGGTPSSLTLTNATGLPIAGTSGWGTGVATALAVNVGTAGAFVVNGGALGTPSSGVATNLTGTAAGLTAGNVTTNANLTGAVTSVGNATSLGSFSSANLLAALTTKTGTGSAVFGSAPTIDSLNATTAMTLAFLTGGGTQCLQVSNTGVLSATGSACGSGGGITFPQTVAGTTTSGGIPYFSGATTLSSSAALAANALVIGGGAGVAPSTTTTGTGVLTLLGNASSGTGAPLGGTAPTMSSPTINTAMTLGFLTGAGTECMQVSNTGVVSGTGSACGGSGSTGANPTATGSDTANNGVASTFLRSDASFAIQKTSASLFGLAKVDGTTITATSGVIAAVNTGTVTSVGAGCGTSTGGSAITTTGNVLAAFTLRSNTAATDTVVAADCGNLVYENRATSVAVAIAQAGTTGFAAGTFFQVCNINAGVATITPTTSTIGGASTLAIPAGSAANPVCYSFQSDGTNYNIAEGPTVNAALLSAGTLVAARMPALTGDVTSSAGSVATTLSAGSASNLNSGTLAAARGGAGAINGALKGNGSGTVSQAACADLSNGATGCSTATGTSGATLPLLNGTNSWSAVQTFAASDLVLTGGSGCATFAAGVLGSTGTACGGSITFPQTVAGTTTSGGIPYFSGTTTLSSSAALAANAIVIGGGAGVAPATTTTGTGVITAIGNTVNASGGFLTFGITGTSGATLPFLNGTNTWSGPQTFGTVNGTVTTQSGTTYTLTTSDCGTMVRFTNAAAVTVTIPATFTAGCNIAIEQTTSAGQVTMTGSAVTPATLHSAHTYTKTFGQWAIIGISMESTGVAILTGDGA